VCVVVRVDGLRILLAGDTLYGGFSPDIGSDADAWRASLERLGRRRFDALTFGHGIDRLLGDPAGRIAEARLRFGSYYDPWFCPPRYRFSY
jgi:glyoxylase-like metal-dependent hydrolase (beta-lactamase superfamily II)